MSHALSAGADLVAANQCFHMCLIYVGYGIKYLLEYVCWKFDTFDVFDVDDLCSERAGYLVSRVKCWGRTLSRPISASVCEKYDMPLMRPYERIVEDLISACRKHVVAATGPSPFKVRDNQRPERTMFGVARISA